MSDVESMDDDDSFQGKNTSKADREKQLDEEYPNRPKNHSPTLAFHTLYQDMFDPLIANRTKQGTSKTAISRRKLGPDSRSNLSPSEMRRAIIERYISRWRKEVGDDFFPALRLIIPEKDRARGVYGLKEKIIAKLLVKIMKIDRNSEDGLNLLNWKLPGQKGDSAGDFAQRCRDIIAKRPMRVEVGTMTIEEVNDLLDELAKSAKEEDQLPILTEFYKRMNAEELMWLIRVILRQMKVGATEKTFFHIWHPDSENLFNVSSNLRRVCWELHDPKIRLEDDETGVTLMQCFQPQLAQYLKQPFKNTIEKLGPTPEDPEFWIEEKLDGERMQLHMVTDPDQGGGKRFRFWSRKAKDYTYLYGEGLEDPNGALTQHLKNAFKDGVESVILDGEMITWDPEQKAQVPFGTLKTAALAEQRNPFAGGWRPLFRIFDILLLNDQPLTRYTLRDRRRALEASVVSVDQRFEIHDYIVATKVEEVEEQLRKVVAEASEGLVLKNPRSAYRLDDRSGDWQKIKPEYMTEFGESLDCLVIGGFYGSGRRGGSLSSFLCGLRESERQKPRSSQSQASQSQSQRLRGSQARVESQLQTQPESSSGEGGKVTARFISFFKVGGGMAANDYATIRHVTDGKWHKWDERRPPTQYIDIGVSAKGESPKEKPDVWIKPEDSVVVEVKAAQVTPSDDYGCGMTLRFPRFTKFRRDKDWSSALSFDEFMDEKDRAEKKQAETKLVVDQQRQEKRKAGGGRSRKKPLTMAGYNAREVNKVATLPEGSQGTVFAGLVFYIMTESNLTGEHKKSKLELEALVKANGGKIVQTADVVGVAKDDTDGDADADAQAETVCVAARRTVKVASLEKRGDKRIVKPQWLFDCVDQARRDFAAGFTPEIVLPFEPARHLFFVPDAQKDDGDTAVDAYGDSFARDTTEDELRGCMAQMDVAEEGTVEERVPELFPDFLSCRGLMFHGLVLFFDRPHQNGVVGNDATEAHSWPAARSLARFAGAEVLPYSTLADIPASTQSTITHIVTDAHSNLRSLRQSVANWPGRKIPRLVSSRWIDECWKESTRVAEEMYVAK